MPTPLEITSCLHVTPLLDIHHPPFEKLYRDGVYWSLFTEPQTCSMSDRSLLENLRAILKETGNERQQLYRLSPIGFQFGRLHGAILSAQTGELRPGVTTLADFQNKQTARGYDAGREWYFVESLHEQPDGRIHTDTSLLERIQDIESEAVFFNEEEDTWYYALGCILGELSGQIFPAIVEELTRWEAINRFWQAESERIGPHATSELLDCIPIVKYAV